MTCDGAKQEAFDFAVGDKVTTSTGRTGVIAEIFAAKRPYAWVRLDNGDTTGATLALLTKRRAP